MNPQHQKKDASPPAMSWFINHEITPMNTIVIYTIWLFNIAMENPL